MNTFLCICALFGIPCLLSLGSFRFWKRLSLRWGLVDDPGYRKIHTVPTSLAGGVTVLASGTLACLAYVVIRSVQDSAFVGFLPEFFWWLGGLFGFFILGLVDDLRELKAGVKFLFQLILVFAVAFRFHLTLSGIEWIDIPLTAFGFGVILNSLNFLDNMNGLCTGLGILLLATLCALKAMFTGDLFLDWPFYIFIGALLGFLGFNYPRAQAFLGDSGSHLVGYLVASGSILVGNTIVQGSEFPPTPFQITLALVPLFIALAVPLYDLSTTLFLRWRQHRPLYIGDTSHISHRLVRRGWTPARAVGLIWAATFFSGLFSLLLLWLAQQKDFPF